MQKVIACLFIVAIASAFTELSPANASDACRTTAFRTELVKVACKQGGQKAAKAAMKTWSKEKKIKSCNACHSKLAPSYELKTDALVRFRELGGR